MHPSFYQKNDFFFLKSSVGLVGCQFNAFQIHRTHVLTTPTEKITLKTHFFMILHQFNAKKIRRFFSLFSNIFIFTSLAINYSPKLWHQSICHSFHQTVYSFHRKNHKNPTKINGSVMISLIVDQQVQNPNRIECYSQNSERHAGYLTSWHTYAHTHDLSNLNEFVWKNQPTVTNWLRSCSSLSVVSDSDFSEYR